MDALKFKSAGLGTPCTVGDDVAGGFSITRGTDQFYDAETAISVSAADAIRLRDWLNAKYPAPPAAAHGDEAVRKDAERYRWISANVTEAEVGRSSEFHTDWRRAWKLPLLLSQNAVAATFTFDEAIDAAMRAQGDGGTDHA